MDILFIGGSGQISLPCVTHAVELGHNVSLFNRGTNGAVLPAGVTSIVGDMSDPSSYNKLGDQHWDVVCQFIGFRPEQVAQDIATFAGKTDQYVYISSASVYEKPASHYIITENTPTVNPFWKYSQDKIACEALIRSSKNLPWTIVRPSHTMRVGLPALIGDGDDLGYRILAGKPVIVAGDGLTPWTLTRPVDFAVPFVGLFGKSAAIGEDFHITSDRGYTWNSIYDTLAAGLGTKANIVHVPTDVLVRYEPDWAGPLFGDKSWTALFDNSKVKKVAGDFTCSEDLATVLAEPVATFKQKMQATPPPPSASDLLMDKIAADISQLGT